MRYVQRFKKINSWSDNKLCMFNKSCSSSQKKIPRRYPQSTGFIRDKSPNRFRNTLAPGEFSQGPLINRLRHSFSATTIEQCFEQYLPRVILAQQQKRKTLENLKTALDHLEDRICKASSPLVCRDFKKKPMSKIVYQDQCFKPDKNRQTISTEATHACFQLQKVSKYITSQPKPANFHPFLSNPYDSKTYNAYYVSQAIRAANQKNSLAVQHINGSIKMIQSCLQYAGQTFYPKSTTGFQMERLPRDLGKKKTLVLDLDQTLIHCYENLDISTDIGLSMNIQGQKVKVGVNIRPCAMTFLKKMAKIYEIVIFTASHQTYANAILDQLDPENLIFSHRFYRPHCVVLPNQLHVKDLRCLKRDLKDVVLVDNAAYSYAFQLDNGIPILPFYQGRDFELSALQKYLEKLVQVDDVRTLNREYFKLHRYSNFQNAQELIKSLYGSQNK